MLLPLGSGEHLMNKGPLPLSLPTSTWPPFATPTGEGGGSGTAASAPVDVASGGLLDHVRSLLLLRPVTLHDSWLRKVQERRPHYSCLPPQVPSSAFTHTGIHEPPCSPSIALLPIHTTCIPSRTHTSARTHTHAHTHTHTHTHTPTHPHPPGRPPSPQGPLRGRALPHHPRAPPRGRVRPPRGRGPRLVT